MNIRLFTLLAIFALGGLSLTDTQAQTNPIVGDVDFIGVATFNTMSLSSAKRVKLWDISKVVDRSGTFTSFVNPQDNVTMSAPWIFNSGTVAAPMPGPSRPALWSVGGFTFDLTTSNVVLQTSGVLNVTGFGTVSGNGFDPTLGLWSFTASNDGSQQSRFSFQANTSVPEAGTVVFFALGGLGLIAVQYRRWKCDPSSKITA